MRLPQIETTTGDKLLILFLLILAGAMVYWLPGVIRSKGAWVEALVDNKVVGVYSLNEDRTIAIKGPLGVTEVKIENGRASILRSPCPGKYCIGMGPLGKEGGALICVPNRVVVRTTGSGGQGLDAVTR